jgi:hypothetical protein
MRLDKPQRGILKFQDGTQVEWEFVEHVPYEPSAYHWDEGIIVASKTTEYFISLGTGDVYGQSDDDSGLNRLMEEARCPEIDKRIEDFTTAMEAHWEETHLG